MLHDGPDVEACQDIISVEWEKIEERSVPLDCIDGLVEMFTTPLQGA